MTRTPGGTRWTFGALALLVLVAAGCGSSGGSTNSGTSSDTKGGAVSELEGRQWLLTTALTDGAADVAVTAQFAKGSMSGNSGCNSYTTSYTVTGSSLTLGANIAGTKMACPPVPTAVERAYLARLPKVGKYAVKGSTLTLSDNSGTTLLTYDESRGASALAGSWEVTGYYTGTGVQSPAVGSKLTAAFADPQVSGDAGCNTFSGEFTVTGSTFEIGALASTQMACADPAVSTQEQQYLAALQAATTYAVAGSRLDLMRADGGYAVTFVNADTQK